MESSWKPKFKVGDKVRISKYKRKVFEEGYTLNWSEEIFVIDSIQYTNQITYILKELNNDEITGTFYEPELLKAKQDVFRIEKILRRDYKKKLALVKWKGYGDDLHSWIPLNDLKNINNGMSKQHVICPYCSGDEKMSNLEYIQHVKTEEHQKTYKVKAIGKINLAKNFPLKRL